MAYRSSRHPPSSHRSGSSGGGYGSYGGSSDRGRPRPKSDGAGMNMKAPKWDSMRLAPFQKDFYQESPITASRPQAEVDAFMEQNQLIVEGNYSPRPIQTFDELVVPEYLKVPIHQQRYLKPTAIQSQAWPIALKGRDLVGIAQTGSGKTYSFVLPAILHIKNQPPLQRGDGPIALMLCPTRELSQQVAEVAQEFSQTSGVRVTCVYGGSPKGPQLNAIERGCELVIATPGRLLDFMEARQIKLDRTTYLVLDEADRMLDMGFEPQIRKIIQFIRPDRQTLMWSATWPRDVHNLAQSFLTEYIKINVGALSLHANHNIVQVIDVCEEYEKEGKLIRLLEEIMRQPENKTIIFTETKRKADDLTGAMRRDGWPSLCIHGDKKQAEREWVLEDFKCGRTPILVATDVAARGLDISDVKYVINFDYPGSSEDYVHRIGRTARSDRTGTAYTFFTSKNFHKSADLIKVLEEAHQTVPPRLRDVQSYTKPGRDKRSRGGGGGYGGRSDRDSKPSSMSRSNAFGRSSSNSYSSSSSRRGGGGDDHSHSMRSSRPAPPPPSQPPASYGGYSGRSSSSAPSQPPPPPSSHHRGGGSGGYGAPPPPGPPPSSSSHHDYPPPPNMPPPPHAQSQQSYHQPPRYGSSYGGY